MRAVIKRKWMAVKAVVVAHLADDWRYVHRFYSTWAASTGLSLIAVWQAIPDTMRACLPRGFLTGVACTTLVLVLVGRILRQDFSARDVPPRAVRP